MYRGVTHKVLEHKIDPNDEARVAELARGIHIELRPHPKQTHILVDGKDVSSAIRTEEIAKNIGPIARNPAVRAELVKRQQQMGQEGSVVMDGRDIGTVVFPNAQLKVFMTASGEERARRRLGEYKQSGAKDVPSYEEILADIKQRDHNDMTREVGPLKQAEDAVLLETDGMTIEQQVEFVVGLAKEREQKRIKN
jgi:cytidylate kinase